MNILDFDEMRNIFAECGGGRGLGDYIDKFVFLYEWTGHSSTVKDLSEKYDKYIRSEKVLSMDNHPILPNVVIQFNKPLTKTGLFTVDNFLELVTFERVMNRIAADTDKTESGLGIYAPSIMMLYIGDDDGPFDVTDDTVSGRVEYLDNVIKDDEALEWLTGKEIDEIEDAIEAIREAFQE